MDTVENMRWLGNQLDADAKTEGIGQGSEGARYCWKAATEIESLRSQVIAQQAVIEQMREALSRAAAHVKPTCFDLYEELTAFIALSPSSEALEARDRVRDAKLLRALADEMFYHRDRDTLLERAASRESGELKL